MVITSGRPAKTGLVVVVGVALLLPVFVSPVTGVVVALNVGFVPTTDASGVTGTMILMLSPAAIGPGFVHVTVWPLVEHVEPLVVKFAGADVPVGNVIVVVIMPGAGPVPTFLTVICTSLGWPTVKVGDG